MQEDSSKMPEVPSNEGRIETGRNLDYYSEELFFEPKLLNNKKVLNLGVGSSNLGQELKKRKINCQVVDVDLTYDPYLDRDGKPLSSIVSQLIDRFMDGHPKKRPLIRKIMRTENRNLIQGDMLKLPFADKSFDYIFALHSTYQLPSEKKLAVFREMLRVANTIHLSPILKEDLYFFINLIENEFSDFEVVLSHPVPHPFLDKPHFKIEKEADYMRNENVTYQGHRVWEPAADEVIYKKNSRGLTQAYVKGGNTLILRRKTN